MCSASARRSSASRSRASSWPRSWAQNSSARADTSTVSEKSKSWKGLDMAKSRLHELSEHDQSVWIDYLSRDTLGQGELARMMEEDAVVGVTSNPTIFQKAIAAGSSYDEQLMEVAAETTDPKEV